MISVIRVEDDSYDRRVGRGVAQRLAEQTDPEVVRDARGVTRVRQSVTQLVSAWRRGAEDGVVEALEEELVSAATDAVASHCGQGDRDMSLHQPLWLVATLTAYSYSD